MNSPADKKEKISLSRRGSNLCWILKIALSKNPILILHMVISVGFSVLSSYINVNVTRWILDRVEAEDSISDIICFIVAVFSYTLVSNLVSSLFSCIILPRKYIELNLKMRNALIDKVRHIDLVNFQNPEFFNKYSLGLKEVDTRAVSLLGTIEKILSGLLCFFIVTGVTSTISGIFSVWGIFAAAIPLLVNLYQQKQTYNFEKAKTPDLRKNSYIGRVTTLPEYSPDLKVYPDFTKLLQYKSYVAVESMKKLIFAYGRKTFLLGQLSQVPELLFKHILPWVTIALLLFNGKITVAEATVLATASKSIPSTLSKFVNGISALNPHSLYIENMRKIYEYPENIESETEPKEILTTVDSVITDSITFSYAADSGDVLKGISLNIEKGKKYALVGYNGAGKSTLAKLMMRLYAPKDGNILINGKPIGTYSVRSIREKIAYLGQDFKIYGFSVAENILMRPVETEKDRNLVKKAIERVGLTAKIASLPDGIDTNVTREFDKGGAYFSGGEMQKLALARLYAGDFDCIILDESTSALDPISEDEILNTVFEAFKDKTIIMISHRLVCIKYVDEILFMSQGLLAECGTQDELMNSNGDYSKFYSAQASKYYKTKE